MWSTPAPEGHQGADANAAFAVEESRPHAHRPKPQCTPPPCNSYALVIATVGVGTVLIWYLILIRYKCSAAKAARDVWGMARVFDGKLYFTRDHMQGNFIPKNLKLPEPKPAPKPRAKASSKASSSGEHVQLFRMVYDRKKGFQSEHL